MGTLYNHQVDNENYTMTKVLGQKSSVSPGVVYCVVNPWSRRVYVGSTSSPETRFREHLRDLQGNHHPNRFLQNDWNKTPGPWIWVILEEGVPPSLLLLYEQVYLSKVFDCQERCYNILPKVGLSHLGVRRSQETKERISKGNRGKTRTQVFREELKRVKQSGWGKPVYQWQASTGRFLGSFPGLREAERQTGVSRVSISGFLRKRGTRTHAGGFFWTQDSEGREVPDLVERFLRGHRRWKKGGGSDPRVWGLDPRTGRVLEAWRSPWDLARAHGESVSGVLKVLEGTRTRWGLIWRPSESPPLDLEMWDKDRARNLLKRGWKSGREVPQETREKISRTKNRGREVVEVDSGGRVLRRFGSTREAARAGGVSRVTILRHCGGKVGTPKWKWNSWHIYQHGNNAFSLGDATH